MQSINKNWLVRTKAGEILGPFSETELVGELQNRLFSVEDEIAEGGGHLWMSASVLVSRDLEEITRTSTRQTSTGSVTGSEPNTFTSGPKQLPLERDELTPTPEPVHPAPNETKAHKPRVAPIITGVVILFAILTFLFQLKPGKETSNNSHQASVANAHESESPFVKQIYALIQSGETATALKKLTEYHEKAPKKDSLEYLVPYAALLIQEGESIGRAKKFLEQVLSSNASPQLKARAHHWLGYLLLSQDEGDMGESHFLESLQLNPKDPVARFNLGRAYLKQQRHSQALDYLQLAELEVPDLWLIHIYKGRAKVALGNMEEAKLSFKAAIAAAPDRWISYIYYSLYLLGIRDYDEARNTLRKMLTKDPTYEMHTPAPFGYFQEKVNYAEYLSAFNHVMDKGSPEERELGKLYISYLISGGTEQDYKRFQALSEKGGPLTKIIALKILLDHKPGAEEIKQALSKLPSNLIQLGSYALVLRGEAKVRLNLLQEAHEDFVQALKLDPKSAISHWALASLLERMQKREEAQGEIRSLLGYHPNYIPAIVSSHNF